MAHLVVCEKRYNLVELIEVLNRILDTSLMSIYAAVRSGAVRHSQADISKAEKALGHRSEVEFGEGVERAVGRMVQKPTMKGGDMSGQSRVISPSTMPSMSAAVLAELIGRLTIEEKRKLAKVIDWDELQRLRKSEKRIGDPKVYVGTTENGLSLELPVQCVRPFIQALPASLSVESVEIFAQDGNGSREYSLAASELEAWLASHANVLQEGSIMIEFGPHTLISGGGGCLSLSLENASSSTLRKIARKALTLCGFDREFKGDKFSALVWKDQLEVGE